MMNSTVCSVCEDVTGADNAKEFKLELPKIGKRLILKTCVVCQEKAKTNSLYICLGCKSITWYPSGNFRPDGIEYIVKFQCNNCITKAISKSFAVEEARV